MRIGIFGGSFDPIHHAHLIAARLAAEQLHLDQVRFVVARSQPLKLRGHAAPATDRLRMVELAIDGIADFVADSRELERPGPSYTVETLQQLAAERPGAELVLLLGADAALGFDRWREPAEVRRLARLAVWRREGTTLPEPLTDACMPVDVPTMALSATAIRARAKAGRPLDGWVPRAVADYILASRIYGNGEE